LGGNGVVNPGSARWLADFQRTSGQALAQGRATQLPAEAIVHILRYTQPSFDPYKAPGSLECQAFQLDENISNFVELVDQA
jgi:hypothetical protein